MAYVLDFSLVADANPYAPSGLTVLQNTFQIASGLVRGQNGLQSYARYSGTPGTTLSVTIKTDQTDASSLDWPFACVLDSSINGYAMALDSGNFNVYKVIAGVRQASTVVSGATGTVAAGDSLTFLFDPATGNITCSVNGTSKATGNDTTYTTGLAESMGYLWNNSGAHHFTYWSADNVSAGATTKTASDTIAVKITESPVSDIFLGTTETIAAKITESHSLTQGGTTIKSASDTVAVKISEGASLGGAFYYSATDTLAVKVVDTGSLVVPGTQTHRCHSEICIFEDMGALGDSIWQD